MFFHDPADESWHTLRWVHAPDVPVPFSAEALAYARRLARQTSRFPDDRRALAELLERWDAGLTTNPAERRMALRLSQQRAARMAADPSEAAEVEALASVRALFGGSSPPDAPDDVEGGDDDVESELTAGSADETVSEADFYSDAFETIG